MLIIDSGPLPGMLQSAYRAEIYAVYRALNCLRLQPHKITIWSDCKAVVSRLGKLILGSEPKPNSSHADLRNAISDCLRDLKPGQVSITKVAAHQRVHRATSPLEEWCAIHNNLVDQAANQAQWLRPTEFWNLFDRHLSSTKACQSLSRTVQMVLLRVSKLAVRQDSGIESDERGDLGLPAVVPPGTWKSLSPLHIPQAAVRWYGDHVVRAILSWYWQSVHESRHDVIWVSQYHLYLDFEMSGERGPTKFDVWRSGQCMPHLDLLSVPFQTRARWFNKVLKESLRHHGQGSIYAYCRPQSRAVFMHTGCLAVPWDPTRIECIDSWLLEFCPGGVFRTSKSLENLPIATKHEQFSDVFFSQV